MESYWVLGQRPEFLATGETTGGNIHRIVGGAPLHLSRCDYTNGCAGSSR